MRKSLILPFLLLACGDHRPNKWTKTLQRFGTWTLFGWHVSSFIICFLHCQTNWCNTLPRDVFQAAGREHPLGHGLWYCLGAWYHYGWDSSWPNPLQAWQGEKGFFQDKIHLILMQTPCTGSRNCPQKWQFLQGTQVVVHASEVSWDESSPDDQLMTPHEEKANGNTALLAVACCLRLSG